MSYWHPLPGGDRVWVTDEENEAATEDPLMHPAFEDIVQECERAILDEAAHWQVFFDGGCPGECVGVTDAARVAARMIVNQIAREQQHGREKAADAIEAEAATDDPASVRMHAAVFGHGPRNEPVAVLRVAAALARGPEER